MPSGDDQVPSLYVTALLRRSTATQKLSDAQEMEVSPPPVGSTRAGDDQEPFLYVTALPPLSTAAQKLADGQVTKVRLLPPGSILTGPDQVLPS
jgi:hypothetical protein